MNRMSGKVAIVTGAAQNMGAAIARRLIEEGAKVMLTDVLEAQGEKTAKSLGLNACFMRHDVSKETDWKQVINKTEAEYRRIIDTNQISVFLGMKSVIPSMKRGGTAQSSTFPPLRAWSESRNYSPITPPNLLFAE